MLRPLRVVATNERYGKLLKSVITRLRAKRKPELAVSSFGELAARLRAARDSQYRTLVVSRASDIPVAFTGTAKHVQYLVFAEGFPIEAFASRLPRLRIRDPQRIHIAREQTDSEISMLAYRVISGRTREDDEQRVADAWIEGDRLVLLSPAFERLYVPLSLLVPFIGDDPGHAANFEIDEDGSFLYWPESEVHLGWEQFVQLVDPAAAAVAEQRKQDYGRRYGEAIRRFREEQGIKQSNVESVNPRHLRRVEHGDNIASKAVLAALAAAHGLPLEEYLKQIANRVHR